MPRRSAISPAKRDAASGAPATVRRVETTEKTWTLPVADQAIRLAGNAGSVDRTTTGKSISRRILRASYSAARHRERLFRRGDTLWLLAGIIRVRLLETGVGRARPVRAGTGGPAREGQPAALLSAGEVGARVCHQEASVQSRAGDGTFIVPRVQDMMGSLSLLQPDTMP
ncbi:MAG TPA: hypothetical protein P5515_10205 [Methanolinea sp.]|nr:hypothetical protein [Methanolinea sp.]